MDILVASSSAYRQSMYREAIAKLGHRVHVATSGVDCVQRLRQTVPEMLILEAPLSWGGSDGVLEIAEQELGPAAPPVIVMAVGSGSIDWFQLSRFRIDDFLFRVPTTSELGQAIATVAAQRNESSGRQPQRPGPTQRSSLKSRLGVASSFVDATPWSGVPLNASSPAARH